MRRSRKRLASVPVSLRITPRCTQASSSSRVQSRQYTGRNVTVSNARIFDERVYIYTRNFPYTPEEMHLPISYKNGSSQS